MAGRLGWMARHYDILSIIGDKGARLHRILFPDSRQQANSLARVQNGCFPAKGLRMADSDTRGARFTLVVL